MWGFSLSTPTTCMPLPTFHILTRAPQCIPSQLRGGSSQMLLLKWRYVNQGNLRDYPDSHMGRTAGLGDWHTNRDGWRITCRICRVMLSFSNEWGTLLLLLDYTVETTQKGHVTLATVWDRWVRLEPVDVANTVAHSAPYPADSQSGLKLF